MSFAHPKTSHPRSVDHALFNAGVNSGLFPPSPTRNMHRSSSVTAHGFKNTSLGELDLGQLASYLPNGGLKRSTSMASPSFVNHAMVPLLDVPGLSSPGLLKNEEHRLKVLERINRAAAIKQDIQSGKYVSPTQERRIPATPQQRSRAADSFFTAASGPRRSNSTATLPPMPSSASQTVLPPIGSKASLEPPPPPTPKPRAKADSAILKQASDAMNSRYSDMFKAFQFIDLDRSGFIGKKEIARALDLWNIPISHSKLDDLMAACDVDGDGQVSYQEFVDGLARDTVTLAAMGKRDMNAMEAMGVADLDKEFLGHKHIKNVKATINDNLFGEDDAPLPEAKPATKAASKKVPRKSVAAAAEAPPPAPPMRAPPPPAQPTQPTPAPVPTQATPAAPKKLKKRDITDQASNAMNSRFSDMFKAFQYMDLDRSGLLGEKEIARALDLWNIPITRERLRQLIEDCDTNGDGQISYEEFVDAMARDTVTLAAQGKRGMQSMEAMGVADLDKEFLGHKHIKNVKATINDMEW